MDRVTAADRPWVLVAVPPVCAALAWLAVLAVKLCDRDTSDLDAEAR